MATVNTFKKSKKVPPPETTVRDSTSLEGGGGAEEKGSRILITVRMGALLKTEHSTDSPLVTENTNKNKIDQEKQVTGYTDFAWGCVFFVTFIFSFYSFCERRWGTVRDVGRAPTLRKEHFTWTTGHLLWLVRTCAPPPLVWQTGGAHYRRETRQHKFHSEIWSRLLTSRKPCNSFLSCFFLPLVSFLASSVSMRY